MVEQRELLGKLFFTTAILILIYMFITPISHVLIHVDEYWTYSLVNLPFIQGLTVAAHDVHPPLYYMILYLFTPFGLENIYILKIVSIIPYILLMFVSYFKIRKDYNWLTAGLFIFCIGIMSDFFIEFLTIRMYSWGVFFVIMAFIYFKDVLTKWDKKSWILLTLFTLLSAYTQYLFTIPCGLIYILLLVKILKSEEIKSHLKQFIFSAISLVVLYAPWMVVFIHQLKTHPTTSNELPQLMNFFNFLTVFAVKNPDFSFEMIVFKIIALIFLVIILLLIYNNKAKYEASGIVIMFVTISASAFLIMGSARDINTRYLLPVLGIFWLCSSITVGKIENNKFLAVMLALIIVLAGISVFITQDDISDRLEFNDEKSSFLKSINNNDSVIVYDTDFGYQVLHDDLNKTKQYSVKDTYFYDNDIEISGNLDKIINKNSDKNIYLVLWDNLDSYKKYDLDEKFESGYGVYQIGK